MSAVVPGGAEPQALPRAARGSRRTGAVQNLILTIAALFLAAPLLASAAFGFSMPEVGWTTQPLVEAFNPERFWPPLQRSIVLAVLTTVGSFVLLIPTLIFLHLKAPRLLKTAEVLSVLPIVIPAIALVNGANLTFRSVFPAFLTYLVSLVPFYVVIAMPLVYRSLDAGIRALDLPTLYQASQSLGAGHVRTLVTAILPNLRSALLTSALLCFTLALGEFVLASLLLHFTFPAYVQEIGMSRPRAAAALSFLTIAGTWALLQLIAVTGNRRAGRAAEGDS